MAFVFVIFLFFLIKKIFFLNYCPFLNFRSCVPFIFFVSFLPFFVSSILLIEKKNFARAEEKKILVLPQLALYKLRTASINEPLKKKKKKKLVAQLDH